jgi:hypothetical protein
MEARKLELRSLNTQAKIPLQDLLSPSLSFKGLGGSVVEFFCTGSRFQAWMPENVTLSNVAKIVVVAGFFSTGSFS